MSSLWSNVTFRRLFFGRIVTNVGDSLYIISTMWLVHELGGSTFYTGLAGFLTLLPRTIQFLTGPVVDRVSISRLLVATQVVQAVLILSLPVAAYANALSVPLILVVVPVLSTINQFVYPAQNAALPRVVDDENLARANSLFSFAYDGVNLAFNAVGGVVIALFGAIVLYVADSITFVLAAVLFATATIPRATTESTTESATDDEEDFLGQYVADLREGFQYIRDSLLKYIVASVIVTNFGLGVSMGVLPMFAELRGGPELYGALLAALAGGTLTGALLASVLENYPFGALQMVLFVLASVTWVGAVYSPWIVGTIGLFFVAWIPVGAFNVLVQTLSQSAVPENLIGRVTSASVSVAGAAAPVGSLLGGIAADAWGTDLTLAATGISFLSIVVFFGAYARLRRLPPLLEIDDDLIRIA